MPVQEGSGKALMKALVDRLTGIDVGEVTLVGAE